MATYPRPSLLVAALLGGLALGASAEPTLTTSVDSDSVRLGDPLRLRLRVERDAESRTLFADPADELAPWVLRSAPSPTSSPAEASGLEVDEWILELAAYRLDVDPIPALEIPVVTASGDTFRLSSEPIAIRMLSVRDPDEGEALREIKPPVSIPGGLPLWLAALLALALCGVVAWLLNRFLRRRTTASVAPSPRISAPVDYEREFARIADMGLLERGAVKLYYTHLSEVMRRFLEDRLTVEALERTTAEIAADLRRRPAPPDANAAQGIVAFLQAADLVKFARAQPPETEAVAAPEQGRQLVADVDAQLAAAAALSAPVTEAAVS